MKNAWRLMGIAGAGRGTGVTHLALKCANYLAGTRKKRVAVLEWNTNAHFSAILRFYSSTRRIFDVDYFACADRAVLAECLERNYEHMIVDFGEMKEESFCECVRCDRRLLVGAWTEWQTDAFLQGIKVTKEREKSWEYLAVFGSEETRKMMEKQFSVTCTRIPYSSDAFLVTHADMEFFEKF